MLLPKFVIDITSGQIVSSPGCFQGVDWNRVIPRTKLKYLICALATELKEMLTDAIKLVTAEKLTQRKKSGKIQVSNYKLSVILG